MSRRRNPEPDDDDFVIGDDIDEMQPTHSGVVSVLAADDDDDDDVAATATGAPVTRSPARKNATKPSTSASGSRSSSRQNKTPRDSKADSKSHDEEVEVVVHDDDDDDLHDHEVEHGEVDSDVGVDAPGGIPPSDDEDHEDDSALLRAVEEAQTRRPKQQNAKLKQMEIELDKKHKAALAAAKANDPGCLCRFLQHPLFGVLTVLAALLCITYWVMSRKDTGMGPFPVLPPVQNGVSFQVVGDWGRLGSSAQTSVAAAMNALAPSQKTAFIISTGDNFYENGVTSVTDPQFRTSWVDVYRLSHIAQLPWYVIAGNHDYRASVDAEIQYSQVVNRWHMPARNYTLRVNSTDGGCANFVFIDTSPFLSVYWKSEQMLPALKGQHVAAQVAWLDATLARIGKQCQWLFVVGHHPMFSAADHGDAPELSTPLEPLLNKYNVDAYIVGHDHDLQHIVRDGVDHVVSGAGSEIRSKMGYTKGFVFGADVNGLLSVAFNSTDAVFQFIGTHNLALHQWTRQAQAHH